jgi:hypothetical protein
MAVELIADEPVVAGRLIRGEFVSGFLQAALSEYGRGRRRSTARSVARRGRSSTCSAS